MSNFDEQLKWRIETAESSMVLMKAPDLADDIWQKHQMRRMSKWFALVASITVISFTFWLQTSAPTSVKMPSFIVKSHQYERELATFSDVELSDSHSAIMANWHHELAVIDQTIERGKGNLYNTELWQQRTNLLKVMVEFYTQPADLYEI